MEMDATQRLAAEAEIRNLIARIAHLADDGDLDDYMEVFAEDATWGLDGDPVVRTGLADIRAGAEERRRTGLQGPGTGNLHLNTTLWVELEGPDTARAESYFVFIGTKGADGPVPLKTGRYLDRFQRTSVGWRFASRHIVSAVN